jgi:alpha-L-fucosidase
MSRRTGFLVRAPYCVRRWAIVFFWLVGGIVPHSRQALAQQSGASSGASGRSAAARQWFQDAKFGLFIHWGIYSLVGKGEWVMEHEKLPISEYGKLPPRFNPTKFDAAAWVELAKTAGARYLTITVKHHDGFCMFATKLTDYDIVDATPYHADPVHALAAACHKQGIKPFFYYSLLDWHHPDYFPRGKYGGAFGRAEKGDWPRYVAYYQGQIRELCTNYGEVGGFWFDGWWDRPGADWGLESTYRLIHELQPGALVGNNHHTAPFPGEDFQVFEQDLPGHNSAGFNRAAVAADLPLETCLTMNNSWGYNAGDTHFKSAPQIIRALVGAAARGSNLLLNVGPRPDGTISPEFTRSLLDVGKWLNTYGESVYATRRGPVSPQPWGVATAKGALEHPSTIYLHVFEPKEDAPLFFHPSLRFEPFLFGTKTQLKLTPSGKGLALKIPKEAWQPIDTIIVMTPRSGTD